MRYTVVLSCVQYASSGGSFSRPFLSLRFVPTTDRVASRISLALESGARNACAAAATVAASPVRDTPREEIPPCPAASWSARDSPRAAAPLRLREGRRTVLVAIVEGNLSCALCNRRS